MDRRGGVGGGGDNTFTDTTLTGPPSSTHTENRHIDPNIKGSTGGFIGLIAGIGVVVVLGVFLGFWLYNRRRRRRLLKASRPSRIGVPGRETRFDDAWDPYADPIPSPHDGGNRPKYARAKSEEWEIPGESYRAPAGVRAHSPLPPANRTEYGGATLGMPEQPEEAAAPIRSRSPRLSPRPFERELPVDKGKGKQRAQEGDNPFESEHDPDRLSARIDSREL